MNVQEIVDYVKNKMQVSKSLKTDYLLEPEPLKNLLVVLIFFLISMLLVDHFRPQGTKVPTCTFYGPLIPKLFSRLQFNSRAAFVIFGGYERYKETPYKVLKPDGDLLVLPNRYCEELRALPNTKINSLEATFTNHVGKYTRILAGSQIQTEAIQKCLTPSLARLAPRFIEELQYGFEKDFPSCRDEWVAIKPYEMLLRLVSRAGSRVFVGQPLCRDEAWLEASVTFTGNIFETVTLLRAFPGFMQPIVSRFLPSFWRLRSQLDHVKNDMLIPVIHERWAAESRKESNYERADDFLQWMMDLAKNKDDADPGNLAHRCLGILSMAVVHSSAGSATQNLYDLITMPEYLEPLRAELQEVLPNGWDILDQSALTQMKRLDSFMKESQRVNPPGNRESPVRIVERNPSAENT